MAIVDLFYVRKPSDEFIDACARYQAQFGCNPRTADVSPKFLQALIDDLGFCLREPGADTIKFNGVVLNVVEPSD